MPLGGPLVSFPREIKATTVEIEKTYAPGPASYATYGTVGVIRAYQRGEANPRIPEIRNTE